MLCNVQNWCNSPRVVSYCAPNEAVKLPARHRVEVSLPNNATYHVSLREAHALVRSNEAQWDDPMTRKRILKLRIGCLWRVKQSGFGGPFVMQAEM